MQVLTRLMIIFVLLGSLAYGSYAFGKYVLSAHLLNDAPVRDNTAAAVQRSTRAAEAVTRKTDYKGSEPRVEMKVLPAENDGSGPPPPARNTLIRHLDRSDDEKADAAAERKIAEEAARAEKIIANAENEATRSTVRDDNESSASTSSSTRSRRSDSESDSSGSNDSSSSSRSSRSSRRDGNDSSTSSESSDFAIKPDNSGALLDDSGVYMKGRRTERRRKRRKRTRTTEQAAQTSPVPQPEVSRPSARPESPRATVNTDSPVPRPESSGESPIPQPE